MFYMLAMVTFLSSILIYSLYPRSDGVTSIDIPTAESAAMELVAQHSAALQAATVLTADASAVKTVAACSAALCWATNSIAADSAVGISIEVTPSERG